MENVELMAKIKPKGGGTFAVVDAVDVEMPDGTRLPEALENLQGAAGYPVVKGEGEILPEKYYTFSRVDSLSVTLVPVDDAKAHEYCFEFIPSENFTGLSISPEPRWVSEPQFPAGKTCQVSILMGIGVIACA